MVAIALFRRTRLPRATRLLALSGMILLALATAGATWVGRSLPRVVVMVDVSPSTRGASYHRADELRSSLRTLMGDTPYRVQYFADGLTERSDEAPSDVTTFEPPPADAIVLFSDARFELPATAPPTFVVIDPNLERVDDAAVSRLSADPAHVQIGVHVRRSNPDAPPVRLITEGVLPAGSLPSGEPLPAGEMLFRAPLDPAASAVVARVDTQDRWPENDELRMVVPRPDRIERWWVAQSGAAPDDAWRTFDPRALPTDGSAYLAPSIIVLHNVPADAIPPAAQGRLEQYVRDLGGSLAIFGGEHAFAAGFYSGSTIDRLSPLASAPPRPARQWILLADRSGSMAEPVPESPRTKWQMAIEAIARSLSALPPDDPVSAGSFAQDLQWWFRARPAREAATSPLDARSPGGPTNLQAALDQIVTQSTGDSSMPTELLILSDAQATIDDPQSLAKRLAAARVRVHLLATGGHGEAGNPVMVVVAETGGQLLRESDPARWSNRLLDLLRAANPDAVQRQPADLRFVDSLTLPQRSISTWNATWPRENVEAIARAGADDRVMAARQRVGPGEVLAAAFSPTAQEASAMAALIERAPRDPRLNIRWQFDSQNHVTIDAIDGDRYLTDLKFTVRFIDDASVLSHAVPQSAPGRYELTLPASRRSQLATILLDGAVIDRAGVPGHYAREFDAVGNDAAAMRELARRTGGAVVDPREARPIAFPPSSRPRPLTAPLATLGAAMILIGLVHWRRAG